MTNDEFYSQKKGKQGLGWGSSPQARFLSEEQTTVKTIKANINHSDSHSDCTWRCWCCILRFYTFTRNIFLFVQLTNLGDAFVFVFFHTSHLSSWRLQIKNNCAITTKRRFCKSVGLYHFCFFFLESYKYFKIAVMNLDWEER